MSKGMVDKEIKHHDNSCGVAGVILGILSIALFWIPIVGVVLGIVGVIFAYKQNKLMPNKWSKAGLWICWIGLILSALWTIFYVVMVVQYAMNQIQPLGANAGAFG